MFVAGKQKLKEEIILKRIIAIYLLRRINVLALKLPLFDNI